MANCYIKYSLNPTSWSFTASRPYSYDDGQYVGGATNASMTKSFTVTVPAGITLTALAFKFQVTVTRNVPQLCSFSYNCSVKKGSTAVAVTSSTSGNTAIYTVTSTGLTKFSPGDTLTATITASTTFTTGNVSGHSGQGTITCQWSFSGAYALMTCTVPTTETTITAAKLNAFASIFGKTTATQYGSITRTLWQNIGTAVGTMTTTETGTTKKTAVTFNSTQPLSTNLASVISNMTGGYLARS